MLSIYSFAWTSFWLEWARFVYRLRYFFFSLLRQVFLALIFKSIFFACVMVIIQYFLDSCRHWRWRLAFEKKNGDLLKRQAGQTIYNFASKVVESEVKLAINFQVFKVLYLTVMKCGVDGLQVCVSVSVCMSVCHIQVCVHVCVLYPTLKLYSFSQHLRQFFTTHALEHTHTHSSHAHTHIHTHRKKEAEKGDTHTHTESQKMQRRNIHGKKQS